jgi:hypothetical protein
MTADSSKGRMAAAAKLWRRLPGDVGVDEHVAPAASSRPCEAPGLLLNGGEAATARFNSGDRS